MNIKQVAKKHEAFLEGEYQVYFSPGRVNLIGEHIDYNGGRVFPFAINRGTYAFVSKRDDFEFHLLSDDFEDFGVGIFNLENNNDNDNDNNNDNDNDKEA